MSKRHVKKAAKTKAPHAGRKAVPRAPKAKYAAAAKTKPAAKRKVAGKKMTARAKASSIVLPPNYRPTEDEPFMNERQRLYFRQKLVAWKEEIIRQTRETLAGLHEESIQHADLADRATSETDRALELRARDRQRKLIAKIDAALARIEDGSYGYCEETGEPIGLKRLDARPIATLSVEAQERHERRERVYRED
jgi:RNA polymerase-binding transcription factor